MMPLAGRASVIVVPMLCSLLIAGTASADCAWVLWNESSTSPNPWRLVSAWPDQPSCEQERSMMYTRLRLGPAPPPGIATPLYTQDGKNTFAGTTSYVCMPDTVDPRGPKASGR
jgi:hypothetical protein